mmetsp:Transcript_27182/g.63246  ORF Transcript_27182/g.63246 Transcript_27182/m.63246 type:complete len:270 (+) Transcript_27182:193-1002(+)
MCRMWISCAVCALSLEVATAARPGGLEFVAPPMPRGASSFLQGRGADDGDTDFTKIFEPLDAQSRAMEQQYDLLQKQHLLVKGAVSHDEIALKQIEGDLKMYKTMQKATQAQLDKLLEGKKQALLSMYDANIYDFDLSKLGDNKNTKPGKEFEQELDSATPSEVFQMPVVPRDESSNHDVEPAPDVVEDTSTTKPELSEDVVVNVDDVLKETTTTKKGDLEDLNELVSDSDTSGRQEVSQPDTLDGETDLDRVEPEPVVEDTTSTTQRA